MKAMNLIWIMPLCIIFGWFLAMNFVNANFDFSMDDNTRIAIESLNETMNNVYEIDAYNKLFECQEKLRNESMHRVYLEVHLENCKNEG